MGSFSTVTGLFRHLHTVDVAQGGNLTENTNVDGDTLRMYLFKKVLVIVG